MDLCYNGVCNDNITLGVIPCATTTILYYPNEKSYYFFLAKGYTLTYIAKKMGKNKSTISRELHRNASGKHYLPVDAEAKARQRHSYCRPHKRLDNPVLLKKVKSLISVHQWSPEEISHRLTLEGSPLQVSFVTIYRAIHFGMLDAPPNR